MSGYAALTRPTRLKLLMGGRLLYLVKQRREPIKGLIQRFNVAV